MIEIDLREHAPLICDTNVANEILNNILESNPFENEITINIDGIISISIPCINTLFGGLYDKLGADKFHENIVLKGCSDMLGDFMAYILHERKKRLEENEKDN